METGYRMKPNSRNDYLRRIHPRYQPAGAGQKRRILNEFCANCGYHRKYAIRLLNGPPPKLQKSSSRRPRGGSYSPQLLAILKAIWIAADYPWSVRLKALLPEWMPWIRRRFRLTPDVERQLLRISARTIDYRLATHKRTLRRRLYGRTKPGVLLKHHVPVKTGRWDVQEPGFREIDLVSHSGPSASGHFCHSLNLTDIHTTWTETRALLGKGQQTVRDALDEMRRALPFPLRGIDSDNGSEFLHAHLWRYCQAHHIQFTRGRPYKKDDNAHIEQQNWTHVRRLLGYLRYDSPQARAASNDLYGNELRLFQNLFLPSVKLDRKLRVGSRLRRRYQPPQTPFQRLRACAAADPQRIAELDHLRQLLDPFVLSQRIQSKLPTIFQLSAESQPAPAPPSTVSTGFHRKKKEPKKKEKTMVMGYILKLPDDIPKVTFLFCATGVCRSAVVSQFEVRARFYRLLKNSLARLEIFSAVTFFKLCRSSAYDFRLCRGTIFLVQRHHSLRLPRRNQLHHPHQIMSRRQEAKEAIHPMHSAQLDFAHHARQLAPTEDPLHQFAFLLTDREPRMVPFRLGQKVRPLGRGRIPGHMRHDLALPQSFDKLLFLI